MHSHTEAQKHTGSKEKESPRDSILYAFKCFYGLFIAIYSYTQIDSLSTHKLSSERETHSLRLLHLPLASVAAANRVALSFLLSLVHCIFMSFLYFYLSTTEMQS